MRISSARHSQASAALLYAEVERALWLDLDHRVLGPGVITTVRRTYGTAEAGTRTQYVQYVGPWGQAALRLWYPTREAGTRSPYVPYGGPGAYVSA